MKNISFKQNKSFSLIELIISLAILAIVMFLLLPLLYQGIRLWQFDRDSELALKEARLALMRMGDEISQAKTINIADCTSTGISFTEPNPGNPGQDLLVTFSGQRPRLLACPSEGCQCGYPSLDPNDGYINVIMRTWQIVGNPTENDDILLYYLQPLGVCDPYTNSLIFTCVSSGTAVRRVNIQFNTQRCASASECGGVVEPVHHFETGVGIRNQE